MDFLVDLLSNNQLALSEKNKAYNVAAYLASIFGKPAIMKDFEKLNSMILMTMEKNIDSKVGKIKHSTQNQGKEEDNIQICEYCGESNPNFKD